MGNRLSPHKVSKLRPVEEEGESTEAQEDEVMESKNTKESPSQKKKSEKPETAGQEKQVSRPQKGEAPESSQNKKEQQASLFEESQPQKESKKEKVKANGKGKKAPAGKDPRAFGVGETIELEL